MLKLNLCRLKRMDIPYLEMAVTKSVIIKPVPKPKRNPPQMPLFDLHYN
jgi:hypothetical protein